MKIRRLNKKSLRQEGGQQANQQQAEMQQAQMRQAQMEQAGVSDLVEGIRSAMEQGADIKQLIVELSNQRVPTEDIQQALLAAGNEESDIIDAFSELQSMQEKAMQEKPQQQMAQDGDEVSDEDMMSRDPSEEIAEEDKFQEQGGWQYRKDGDKYYTRKVGEDNWRQAKGDPLTNIKWKIYGEGEKKFREYEHKTKIEELKKKAYNVGYDKMKERAASNAVKSKSSNGIPTMADILKGGYRVKLIEYPKGYSNSEGEMTPGHIESILVDSEGRPISHYMDADNKKREAFVNKWQKSNYNRGPGDGRGHQFESRDKLNARLDEPGMRSADLELSEDQLANYLYSAGLEDSQVYDVVNNNCADGVCRAFGIDDKSVGKSLPIVPEGKLTDPSLVFNTITKNFGVTPTGEQIPRTQQLKDLTRISGHPILNAYKDMNVIDPLSNIYKNTRSIKNDAVDAYNYVDNDLGDDIQEGFYDVMEGAEDAYDSFGKWTGLYQPGGEFNRDQKALLLKNGRSTINQFFGERDGYVNNPLSNYMPMNLGMKGDPINAANAFAESMSNLFSGQINPETGLMSGAFRDNKAKRKRHKISKADDYDYKITVDPNDPNYDPDKLNYTTNARDLYEASKNGTPLPTKKAVAEDLIPRTSIKFNPESQKYETLVMPKDVDWDLYTNKGKGKVRKEYKKAIEEARSGMMDLSEFIDRGQNLSEEDRQKLLQVGEDMDAFNASKDIPENTTFGVDKSGQSVYYAPNAGPENNDEILNDVMMMNLTKPNWQNYNPTPFYNQRRFGGKAPTGVEVGSNDTEFVPEPSQEQREYDAAKAAYDEEMARVMAVRKKTSELARKHGEAGSSYSDVGISDNLANWVNNNGFACNTYSCQIMREAGATIPEGTKPFKLNGRTYKAGDKLPIIPGNAQFNSNAENFGFELQPKGTMPTEEGDLIRGHMYDQPGGASSGSQHSVISAGYGDDEFLDLYNNPGAVYTGYKSRADYENDPMRTGVYEDGTDGYYETDSGVMRYIGATDTLKAKMMEAQARLNKISEANAWQDPELNYTKKEGGQPQQMIPMEPGMMEMYMPSNPMIEIAEGERQRLSETEGQKNRKYRMALEELQKMAVGGAMDVPDLPTDPPTGHSRPLAGKKRFHKFVKPDAMVGDTDYANIDKSGLSEDELGIVDSTAFRMDPRSFRGQVPRSVMRTQRKANKALMSPGNGFGISKPKHEKYNWKLNAKLHGEDQDRDYQRAKAAGVTGDALESYGRGQGNERRGTRIPRTKDRQWDGVKGNLQRIFTDKEYSGAWFPKTKIKENGGSVELDTETIAKLMALGAEIKYL